MALIEGIPVILYERTQTGEDAFHAPVYTETPVTVENVLITPVDNAAVVTDLHTALSTCPPATQSVFSPS